MRSRNRRNRWMHSSALMKDSRVPQAMACQSVAPPWSMSSRVLRAPAAVIRGMDSQKEKRAASSRRSPRKRAAVMVMPEREVPGISARAWARPTSRASFRVRLLSGRRRDPVASDHQSRRPKPMVVVAMTQPARSSLATISFSRMPASPAGMVPRMTAQARRLSSVTVRRAVSRIQAFPMRTTSRRK